MRHRVTVSSPLTANEARDRLCLFLEALGYEFRVHEDLIVFRRSGALNFLPGSAPRSWESRAVLMIEDTPDGCLARLEWTVNTEARLCTSWDADYLKRELRDAVKCMLGHEVSLRALRKAHASAASNSSLVYFSSFVTMALATAMLFSGDLHPTAWGAAVSLIALMLARLHPANAKAAGRTAN